MTTTAQRENPGLPGDKCTTEQMRALFAAANSRGMNHEQLREMCPKGRVSLLTFMEASALLNRLNNRSEGYVPKGKARLAGGRTRKHPGVFAPLSDEQRDLIDRKLRIALGWTPQQMKDHLATRHYTSDDTRTMDSILSTTDGVAVAEHLKKVLLRTLEQHAARLGRAVPEAVTTAQLMKSLPPYERLAQLLETRRAELNAAMDTQALDVWLPDQRTTEGRLLMHVAFCADAAELIYRIEARLRELAPKQGRPVAPAAAEPERNYSFADYTGPRRAAR